MKTRRPAPVLMTRTQTPTAPGVSPSPAPPTHKADVPQVDAGRTASQKLGGGLVAHKENADALSGASHIASRVVSAESSARPKAPWTNKAVALSNSALAAAQGLAGDDAVRAAMRVLLDSPAAKSAQLSFAVGALDGTGVIEAQGADVAQNPCSNAKLATASFALGVLGPAHRFKTEVALDEGRLFVKGAFDPSMTTARLKKIAQRIKAAGVHEVEDVVLDTSALRGDRQPAAFAQYGEQDWTYLARPEALSVNKNVVELRITPGEAPGMAPTVTADQTTFAIDATVETIGPKTKFRLGCDEHDEGNVLIRNRAGKGVLKVWGTIASTYTKGKTLQMKSPAPLESFGDRLRFALEQAGIAVRGAAKRGVTPGSAQRVTVDRSKPLGELLGESLATSNAFDHEMFAAAASLALSEDGTTSLPQTAADMTHFLQSELGLSDDVVMPNGSGIGNTNRLSAADVLKLLRNAADNPRYAPLIDALAAPGEKSTLMTRMVDTAAEGRVRAKTGTGKGAVALSGVVERDGGAPLVFSALVTEHQATRADTRAFLDAVGITLAALRP